MNTSPSLNAADDALAPPPILHDAQATHGPLTRHWQGIASIERTASGRLWAMWYSGGQGEGPDNYTIVATSDDDGQTWRDPRIVIAPPGKVRAYDPCPWVDPQGRLWLFWAQSHEWFDGRCGVWAITSNNPDDDNPTWSAPRRLADGIMMCKPTVLTDGRWLMPSAVWNRDQNRRPDMDRYRFSNVYESTDQGQTWNLLGQADVPGRVFDEHMVLQRRDGSLWMLVRTDYGIGQSISRDGGRTWSPGQPSGIASPGSRFFLRRLQSGAVLLVNHHKFAERSHLTASLSQDDGRTWTSHLLLDRRCGVSYPDGLQSSDGDIYIAYDRNRHLESEILMAKFTEADILAGKIVTPTSQLRCPISHLRQLVHVRDL